MKLTLLITNYTPEIGSAARLCEQLAENLAKRGHEIRVVTEHPRPHLMAVEARAREPQRRFFDVRSESGVTVIRLGLPKVPANSPVARAVEHFVGGPALAVYALLRLDSETVIVFSPPLPLAFAAAFAGRMRNVKVIV